MHDIVNLEARGLPAIAIVTQEFQTAALSQGKSLGFDPEIIYVEHPIQNRTEAEMTQIAQLVFDEIVSALTGYSEL